MFFWNIFFGIFLGLCWNFLEISIRLVVEIFENIANYNFENLENHNFLKISKIAIFEKSRKLQFLKIWKIIIFEKSR